MNTRTLKEMRLLRGPFCLAVFLPAALAWLLRGNDTVGIINLVFAGCACLLAASSFGGELDSRTLLLLLAQPVSRRQVWFEKLLVLGVALILAAGAAMLSLEFLYRGGEIVTLHEMIRVFGPEIVIAFCSASLMPLISKNLIGGAALMVLMPLALAGGFFFICWGAAQYTSHPDVPFLQDFFQQHPRWAIGVPGAIYCATVCWFGYCVFMNFQVIDSHSQEVKLPESWEAALSQPLKKLLPSYTSPLASLIRKELQLQRSVYLVAFVAFVIFVFGTIDWRLTKSETANALRFADAAIYIVLLPILLGAISTAEERNWGTIGWQLTLPISPLKQWLVKMGVSIASLIVLGVIIPVLWFAVEHGLKGSDSSDLLDFALFTMAYVLAFGAFVFASSISLNAMRAIIFAFLLITACAALMGLLNYYLPFLLFLLKNYFPVGDARNGLTRTMVLEWLCSMFALVCCMSFFNFRGGELNSRRKKIQTGVIIAAASIPSLIEVFGI
ncbi:MAG TPA: ABC transporter permease subunit [Verrucomicrobiae bacterium]|jgi:ABC-type transport system involved in multi-copper enzyme maturation permease subunit|nr:ABC transporter permease subunit [Verrucomicrobiae bacterium]